MIANNLRLAIFLIVLLVSQFLINNLTIFYVDLFGALLVISLMNNNSSWVKMVGFSLLADLFGHWYLGTHLIAIVLVSLMVRNLVRYYSLCGLLQRTLVVNLFFIIMNLIIYVIDLLLGRTLFTFRSLFLEIGLLIPLIQIILDKLVIKKPDEFIWYD